MVDGKCVATDAVNYNSSKSNSGNVTAQPTTHPKSLDQTTPQ
jgi:hypothetical protein